MRPKSIIALILALAMTFSLAACNGSQSETEGSPSGGVSGENAGQPSGVTGVGDIELGDGVTKTTVSWFRSDMDVYTTIDTGFTKKTPEGTIIIRCNAIAACDPNSYQDENAWSYNVYEPLLQRDWDTGEIHAMLATDWGYNSDGSYHITLRQDVKFHSGNPMTAADVLYTFARCAANTQNKAASAMSNIDYEKSTIDDDYNLTIVFKEPTPSFEANIASGFTSIMDSKFLEEVGPDYDFLNGDAGTGAYYLVETVSGTSQTFKRFDDWWGGTPDYETVIAKNYSDMTAMNIDYENGDVDITLMNVADSIKRVLSGEITDTVFYDCPVNRGFALAMDTMGEDSPFRDKNVRLALAHCIDMEAVIYACYGIDSMAAQATSFYLPGMKYYYDTGAYEYDPELSIELLAASGYSPENPVHATAIVAETTPNSVALELIQAYASAVGIDLEITVSKSNAVTVVTNSTEVPAEYNLVLLPHHTFGNGDPDGHLAGRVAYNMPAGSYSAIQGVDDQRLAELVEAGRVEMDETKRAEIYQELQQLYHDEAWIVPLFLYGSAVFARNYVGNVKLTSGYSIYWADLTYEG